MKQKRSRLHYAMLTAIVIVAGCVSRSELSELWPSLLLKYSGDTLWALMLFLGMGFLFPRLRTRWVAVVVLVYAFGIEFLQLYHAPWIESFRETFVGAVTIGSDFLWSDFACYAVGCGIGMVMETAGTRGPYLALRASPAANAMGDKSQGKTADHDRNQ